MAGIVGRISIGLLLGLGAVASGCSSIQTDRVSFDGNEYLLADASLPEYEFAVVTVSRFGAGADETRARKGEFERVAEARLRSACAKQGGKPTKEGLTAEEIAEFSVEGGAPSWSFSRLCV